MESVWSESIKLQINESLQGEIRTDVLIIGGGMAGILCAHFLRKRGVDNILVEGGRIGGGVTKNTTAKITSQHGLIYHRLIRKAGGEKARMYLAANELAVSEFRKLSESIDCDFEEKSAFVYSLTDRKAIEDEVTAVNRLGVKAEFLKDLPLPFETAGAIRFERQAQFHPLLFLAAVSRGLRIFENTFVRSVDIKKGVALTEKAKIYAKNIIVATHFPFINTRGAYFLKLYQHRSYVTALENAQDVGGMFLKEKPDGLSFRNYGGLLLVGGGDHRTGKSGGKLGALREFAQKAYPGAREKYRWATQDCMSLDGVPYIGRYSNLTPNLYVASGFNKWGMTSSMAAAGILADMITGGRSEFAEVFLPYRSALKPQLLVNGFEAVTNIVRFADKRCPHMGCALRWNRLERTWDCPCHGSRFAENGTLIDNPATGSVKNR